MSTIWIPAQFIIRPPPRECTPSTRPAHTSPFYPHRESPNHSSPASRWQWRMGRPATGSLPAGDSYGCSSRLTAGATCQVVERPRPLITCVTWPCGGGGGGIHTSCLGREGDVTVAVTDAWSLIKCAGMMGDEYISLVLEGVRQVWRTWWASDDPSVAHCDPPPLQGGLLLKSILTLMPHLCTCNVSFIQWRSGNRVFDEAWQSKGATPPKPLCVEGFNHQWGEK